MWWHTRIITESDACTPAYLAPVPLAVMLAYRQSAALFALALLAVVVTDACAPTSPLASMLTCRRSTALFARALFERL